MEIGVIGLGKLGLCLAAVLSKHYNVKGIDIDKKLIKSLLNYNISYLEPYLKELLEGDNQLMISSSFSNLQDCEIIFCVVPTPSLDSGMFSNEYIIDAIRSAYYYMKHCKVFVVNSTVMPGSYPELKGELPDNISLCYNPEFIALGNVIYGIENPDFVLIGEEDKSAGDLLETIYCRVLQNNAQIKRTNWANAEISKIALNSYITMKISFANMLNLLCEKINNTDAKQIADIIGIDSRINNRYFKPGAPYAGPCFPRDNKAFSLVLDSYGVLNYCKLTDEINEAVYQSILQKVLLHLEPENILKNKVAIFGKSYSPHTIYTFESPAIRLKEQLESMGYFVYSDELKDAKLVVIMMPMDQLFPEDITVINVW